VRAFPGRAGKCPQLFSFARIPIAKTGIHFCGIRARERPQKAGFAGLEGAFGHHINGVFAADIMVLGRICPKSGANPLFAGYACLDDLTDRAYSRTAPQ
jgi:hypothetical protein